VRNTENGQSNLENRITSYAGDPDEQMGRGERRQLLSWMAHGTSEERLEAYVRFYRRHAEYLYGICYNLANRYKFGFFDEEDIFELTMAKGRARGANTFKAGRHY